MAHQQGEEMQSICQYINQKFFTSRHIAHLVFLNCLFSKWNVSRFAGSIMVTNSYKTRYVKTFGRLDTSKTLINNNYLGDAGWTIDMSTVVSFIEAASASIFWSDNIALSHASVSSWCVLNTSSWMVSTIFFNSSKHVCMKTRWMSTQWVRHESSMLMLSCIAWLELTY